MLRPLSLAQHTLFADLLEPSLDDRFPENGSFVVHTVGPKSGARRQYWYYQGYRSTAGPHDKARRYSRYVGRVDDAALGERVAQFNATKAARAERANTVKALVGAGMPRPRIIAGRIVEALAKAGLFQLRGVMIGTAAYQTYGGVLGVRLSKASAVTRNVDVVQFALASGMAEDRIPDVLDVLRAVEGNDLQPHDALRRDRLTRRTR